jgi:hypothetical protein
MQLVERSRRKSPWVPCAAACSGLALLLAAPAHGVGLENIQRPRASADGQESTTLPFRVHRGHFLIDAEVNGQPVSLTLDNGVLNDELLLYGGPRVDALDLQYTDKATLGPEGDPASISVDVATNFTLELHGLELTGQSATVIPSALNYAALFEGEDGVISGALFNHFVVVIDFVAETITLTDPDDFVYEGSADPVALIPFGGGAYTLGCEVHFADGAVFSLDPVLDLGALMPLVCFTHTRADIPLPEDAVAGLIGIGWEGHTANVAEIRIGGHSLVEVPTGFTKAVGKLGTRCEGLLGPGFFARFDVTFDYPNERVYLEPNRHYDSRFKWRFQGWGHSNGDRPR